MKPIRATKEKGQCSICRKHISKGNIYYDVDGLWVHVDCWEKQYSYTLNKESRTHDDFISTIERNSVKAKDIPSMIKNLNRIRGDNAFDETEFVFKNLVLKEYEKRMRR